LSAVSFASSVAKPRAVRRDRQASAMARHAQTAAIRAMDRAVVAEIIMLISPA
jgi:hypothetical protein